MEQKPLLLGLSRAQVPSIQLLCPSPGHCRLGHGHSWAQQTSFSLSVSYTSYSVSGRPETSHPSYELEQTWKMKSFSVTLILTSGNSRVIVLFCFFVFVFVILKTFLG